MSGQVVSASPNQNIGVCPLSVKPLSDTNFITKRKIRTRSYHGTVSVIRDKLMNLWEVEPLFRCQAAKRALVVYENVK